MEGSLIGEALTALVTDAVAVGVPLVLVTGPAGSGRSAVAAELAQRLAGSGRAVVRVAARTVAADHPWRAFDLLLDPLPEPTDIRAARRQLLERLGPTGVIVVDDAHALDASSLALVAELVDTADTTGVGVVLTALDGTDRAAFASTADRCARSGRVIRLAPWTDADVAPWAASQLSAPAAAELVGELCRLSGGNPLLTERLLTGWRRLGLVDRGRLLAAEPPAAPDEVVEVVRARLARLDSEARQAAAALVSGVASTGTQGLEAAGLTRPGVGALFPAVAAALERVLDAAELTGPVLHHAADHAQILRLAERVRRQGGADPVLFAAAANAALAGDPLAALRWIEEAVDAAPLDDAIACRRAELLIVHGPAPHAVTAAVAEAERLLAGAHQDCAAMVLATAFAHRGLWDQAAARCEAAGRPALTELCRAVAGLAVPAEGARGTSHGVSESGYASVAAALSGLARGDAFAIDQLADGTRLAELMPPAGPVPALPHEVAAVAASAAGEWDLAAELLDRALAAGLGGARFDTRLRAWSAWVALRHGEEATAERLVPESDAHTPAREQFLIAAVGAALARRSGDIPRQTTLATRVVTLVPLVRPDLMLVEPAGELVVLLHRFGHPERARDLGERLDAVLKGLGDPPVWRAWRTWYEVEAAVATRRDGDAAELALHAAASAHQWRRLAPLAEAAEQWAAVAAGVVDPDRAVEVADRLQRLGLRWEAAQLVGQAAIRTGHAGDAKALLNQARMLHGGRGAAGPEGGGDVDDSPLSSRERAVGKLVLDGLTHKEIGSQLYISAKTVEHHVAAIRQKLGAGSRAELLAMLRREVGEP